jgi:hypothetical protein
VFRQLSNNEATDASAGGSGAGLARRSTAPRADSSDQRRGPPGRHLKACGFAAAFPCHVTNLGARAEIAVTHCHCGERRLGMVRRTGSTEPSGAGDNWYVAVGKPASRTLSQIPLDRAGPSPPAGRHTHSKFLVNAFNFFQKDCRGGSLRGERYHNTPNQI